MNTTRTPRSPAGEAADRTPLPPAGEVGERSEPGEGRFTSSGGDEPPLTRRTLCGDLARTRERCTGLPYGPLGAGALHLCVDMQTMFAERTDWQVPWMQRVLPCVLRLARARPERTVFTRFVPPDNPAQMPGTWRRYYRRWRHMTRERIDPGLIALVPALAALVPPAAVLDKRHYSPFTEPRLRRLLRARGIGTLVITGAETDVCVLATVLAAVDFGYRVVLASDALCSVSDRTHDALMTLYRERFGQQIETAPVDAILDAWR